MSFTTNIYGNAPTNTFIYTTTTVSATHVSCTNLSATNASIINLSVTIFNPANVTTGVISCSQINSSAGNFLTTHTSTASASTINASGLTATTIVGTTATINTVNAANLNSSILSVSVIAVSTIDATTSNSSTGNFSTLNVSPTANIHTLNASTITGITINSGTSNISSAHISIINNSTIHSSTANMCNFYSYNISGNNLSIVHLTALTSFTCGGTASASTINTSTLNSCNMSTTNLSVNQINSVFITNTSVITTDRVVATTVQANLSENFVAGTGINLSTVLGITTITNTITGVSSPLSVSVINSSTINVCNISTLRINILESSDATQLSYIKRDANVVKFIGKNLSTDAGVDYEFYTNHGTADPRLKIFGSTNMVEASNLNVVGTLECDSFISNTTITGNISGNLAAGAGINLSTVAGITTITNTGLVTSPLSVSVINSSTINVCNISVATINASTGNFSTLTAGSITGMTYSTQYAFLAYGNQNSAQTMTAGTVANFNTVQLCVPDATAYDTTNKRYVTPVSGLYYIGFKVFMFSTGTGVSSRMGIYKNGTLIAQGGNDSANTEAFNVVDQATAGDYYDIRCQVGTFDIYQQQNHSWIYGYLLEPANAVINATTTLNVSQISAGVGNFSTASISTLSTSHISAINASITNLSVVSSNISELSVSQILFDNISGRDAYSTINTSVINATRIGAPHFDVISTNTVSFYQGKITKVNGDFLIDGATNGQSSNIYFSTNTSTNTRNMFYDGNLNISTIANISTISCSTTHISNASILNSSLIICNISTLTVSNTSGINGDFQNSSITALTTYSTAADYLYLINSNDPTQDPATIFKVNSQVDINGGSLAEPSNIRFSINNTSFNMFYDGNLNVSSSANISTLSVSTGTITTLGSTTINASTTNISTHNACVANTLTGNVITLNSSTSNISTLNVSPTATIRTLGSTTINCSTGNISTLNVSPTATIRTLGCTTINASTLNCSTISASTITSRQVGSGAINNFYGAATVAGSTNTSAAYQFNSVNYNTTSLITRVDVAQNAPAANTGAIIVVSGYYKVDVSIPVGNATYADRVTWLGQITEGGATRNDNAYAYSRYNDYGFRVQLQTSVVYYFTAGDYIQYKVTVAKATGTGFTDDFTGLSLYAGGQIVFTFLGTS